MTVALISTSPRKILQTYPGSTANVNVAGLWQVQGVAAGWTSPDGAYQLVQVADFVPPAGQQITGAPSYEIDGSGNVIETYATQSIPPAPIVAVTSSSTPALNGTYGTSMQDQVNLTALQTSITAGVPWIGYLRDIIGVSHTMTAVQFTSIAAAILGFVAAADAAYAAAVAGQSPTWPSNQVTVA